ncbi:hypothetical protein SRHO_G00294980 [Serrasalmus rhombeus]
MEADDLLWRPLKGAAERRRRRRRLLSYVQISYIYHQHFSVMRNPSSQTASDEEIDQSPAHLTSVKS